jgi:hypothetical protein
MCGVSGFACLPLPPAPLPTREGVGLRYERKNLRQEKRLITHISSLISHHSYLITPVARC